MELQVLLWILCGGFTGTWGLCIFFMSRSDAASREIKADVREMKTDVKNDISEIRKEISEIRKEISELYWCVKDHHGRLCILEERNKKTHSPL